MGLSVQPTPGAAGRGMELAVNHHSHPMGEEKRSDEVSLDAAPVGCPSVGAMSLLNCTLRALACFCQDPRLMDDYVEM